MPSGQNNQALQAHVKILSQLVLEYQRKDKSQINLEKYLNQADDSKQSGEQSKSSLINETENEEELHVQKVCRVITIVLKDNSDWKNYVKDVLDPIIQLEKGKLCQQEEKDKESNSSNFDNNLFDDDFINSGAIENNATEEPEEEDEHHKFFKKMQECFSNSNSKSPNRRNSSDLIEIGERESKTKAYAENNHNDVKAELRNSLCDEQQEELKFKRRDRSASNENFGLPPMSTFDDNKDLQDEEQINQNYKSNEQSITFASNLAAASNDLELRIGHLGEIQAPPDLDIEDVDIDLDDDQKDEVQETVPSFDFFGKDLMPEEPSTKDDGLIDFGKIKSKSEENKELDDIKNIFDQIEQLSSDDELEVDFEVHDLSKSHHIEGIK